MHRQDAPNGLSSASQRGCFASCPPERGNAAGAACVCASRPGRCDRRSHCRQHQRRPHLAPLPLQPLLLLAPQDAAGGSRALASSGGRGSQRRTPSRSSSMPRLRPHTCQPALANAHASPRRAPQPEQPIRPCIPDPRSPLNLPPTPPPPPQKNTNRNTPGSAPRVLPLRRLHKLADALELLLLARRPQLGVVPLDPAPVLARLGLQGQREGPWRGCVPVPGEGTLQQAAGAACVPAGSGRPGAAPPGARAARAAWGARAAWHRQRSPARCPPPRGAGTRASS